MAEIRIGKGRLLLCAVDIETDLDQRLVAAKLQAALANYVSGEGTAAPEVAGADVLFWWEGVRA
ncbi:hypothetical protein N8D56_16385 [Devosia sp. A8/3-2]|nr:hypothetical protein N8D56_16385 [Devosia sp. A8/3-2]